MAHIQPSCKFTKTFSTYVKLNHYISVYAIVKLIFENFGILSLKVEIVSFQMIIITQNSTTLKEIYKKKKQKLVALIHGHPVQLSNTTSQLQKTLSSTFYSQGK